MITVNPKIAASPKPALRVLELGGTGRLTSKAYCRYRELSMPEGIVKLHAIDKHGGEDGYEFARSTPEVNVAGHDGDMLDTESWPCKRNVDHVHFHMVDGGLMRISEAVIMIDAISMALNRGGYCFLSLDYHFFSDYAHASQGAPNAPFAFISEVLGGKFEIRMQHYDATAYLSQLPAGFKEAKRKMIHEDQGAGISKFCTSEAETVAKAFGFELPLSENPVKFFELFSEWVARFGAYFAIAQKK